MAAARRQRREKKQVAECCFLGRTQSPQVYPRHLGCEPLHTPHSRAMIPFPHGLNCAICCASASSPGGHTRSSLIRSVAAPCLHFACGWASETSFVQSTNALRFSRFISPLATEYSYARTVEDTASCRSNCAGRRGAGACACGCAAGDGDAACGDGDGVVAVAGGSRVNVLRVERRGEATRKVVSGGFGMWSAVRL